jgi:MarR family transcriptional regulator, lower aerobic nicotinate degradation pathway regulator
MAPSRIDHMPTRLLARANARAASIRIEAFAAAGSSGYASRLLASLADEGLASQAELSRRTGIDPSDVVAVIGDLEAGKLVTRERDPADARRNVISLTRAGRTELVRLDAVIADIQDRFLAPLSAAERAQLTRILTKLTTASGPPA